MSAALRLEAKAGDLESLPADLAIVYKFKGQSDIGGSVGERIARHLGEIARGDRFEGRAGRHLLWHAPPGEGLPSRRYLLLGLGRKEECTLEHYRRHVGEALVEADRLGATSVALPLLEAGLVRRLMSKTTVPFRSLPLRAALGAAPPAGDPRGRG